MSKRARATAIVLNDQGEVLLVRNHRRRYYSLPGGGIKRNEPPISAAAREVYEETGMTIHSINWVLDYISDTTKHHVFIAEGTGEPFPRSEISDAIWWDMKKSLPAKSVVYELLRFTGLRTGRAKAA